MAAAADALKDSEVFVARCGNLSESVLRVKATSSFASHEEIDRRENAMRYKIVLHRSEEGFGVSCPGPPGCWSQGATESEALEDIRAAIQEYLAAVDDLFQDAARFDRCCASGGRSPVISGRR